MDRARSARGARGTLGAGPSDATKEESKLPDEPSLPVCACRPCLCSSGGKAPRGRGESHVKLVFTARSAAYGIPTYDQAYAAHFVLPGSFPKTSLPLLSVFLAVHNALFSTSQTNLVNPMVFGWKGTPPSLDEQRSLSCRPMIREKSCLRISYSISSIS